MALIFGAAMKPQYPSGTVTFLFTDIEGSTKLAQEHRELWESLRARHHAILQSAMDAHHGYVFQIIGDAFCVAFHTAGDALQAATKAQIDLHSERWGYTPIKARMGIHTGKAEIQPDGQYMGYLALCRVQRLMSAGHGGQTLLSRATQDLTQDELPQGVRLRDLGEHRLKDLIHPEHIYQVNIPNLPTEFPALKTLDVQLNNLPVQLTSFIGRGKEITEIKQALEKHRLVTLTGSGGTGKTRLSLQVAADLVEQFPDGVWFIELAPLSDPEFVLNTVAAVLGVREETGRPLLATLMDWLSSRELLLVLDNCEHLIEACAQFADAGLHASRETRILATSREALGITGESAYRVPSLEIPNPKLQISIEQLTQYNAVRLFVERATQALSTFRMTNDNAPAIAQICFQLDGIPLAIELAASRVKALAVDKITERLEDRFRLLTGGSRTALPRQKTLRALIDWSYDLLSEPERVLLQRLSVFAGGWTLEAAEDVCANGDIVEASLVIARNDILDLLTRLVDKSLVVLDEQAENTRYRMLETIRHYAGEKLLDANEREQLRDQHLRVFTQVAEHTQPILETAQRTAWLPRLESEHDNLRAALGWAVERDLETARWLAGMLERFWFFGDHLSEARTWYARVLNAGERTSITKGLALALLSSGCVSLNLEQLDEAQVSLESSVVSWQQLGEPHWLAWSLAWLAYLLMQRGERMQSRALYAEHESLFRASMGGLMLMWVLSNWGVLNASVQNDDPSAKALLDEALSLAHTLQDPFAILLAYSSLGDWAVVQGDYATARRHFLESLEWRRQLGTRWIIAAGLRQVANLMCLRGDYQQAEPLYIEALAMARALGDQHSEASIAQALGEVAIHRGDIEQATILLVESLSSFRKWADALGIARCLMGFVNLRQAQKDMERAAHLLGFVEAWLDSNQLQLVFFDHTNYARSVAAARTQLDETAFTTAWEKGRAMTLDQSFDVAMKDE
jgi:predicted ATPase/class 3 adenylate cyclase